MSENEKNSVIMKIKDVFKKAFGKQKKKDTFTGKSEISINEQAATYDVNYPNTIVTGELKPKRPRRLTEAELKKTNELRIQLGQKPITNYVTREKLEEQTNHIKGLGNFHE